MYTREHTIPIKLVFWCQNPDCKGKSTLTIKNNKKKLLIYLARCHTNLFMGVFSSRATGLLSCSST